MQYKWPLMKDTITWSDKLRLIKFIATSSQYTNGPQVRQFESAWNNWLGSKYSLFVSSGSTANTLLVSAVKELYKLKTGDKVLVPACTWSTNIGPLLQCGLRPIFADINLLNYSFDLNHLYKIREKHRDIKMIFVTHLLGFSANVEKYKEIFPDALILEDVCESHGCTNKNGIKRGADSLGATFSFYFGHHMTTIEGGMVSTNNENLYNLMRCKRSHGLARELPTEKYQLAKECYPDVDPKFLFLTDGYNFRNTEIAAVLGQSQLTRLDQQIQQRKSNFRQFCKILENFATHLHVCDNAETNSSFSLPIVPYEADVATIIKAELDQAGIETRPIVSGNLLKQPFLSDYSLEPGSNSNIDLAHTNGVYIGNNHFISKNELELLSQVLTRTLG